MSLSGLKSSKPSDTLYFGASEASPEKGVWAMALFSTPGDFAFGDAMSCWHLLGDGAVC